MNQDEPVGPPSDLREAARSIYGSDASGYARGRPDYPARVYEILEQRCGLGAGATVLEVGAGTGLVTCSLLAAGARVTVVEPDPAMAGYLSGTFGAGLEVLSDSFEEVAVADGRFDLVVAATSFHWVDQRTGMPKLGRALRPGGWAALWWTVFDDPAAEDPFGEALSAGSGLEDPGGQRKAGFQLDAGARCHDLATMAGLRDVEAEIIRWTLELGAAGLQALYGSLLAVRRLPAEDRQRLLDVIAELCDRQFGGRVIRPFVTAVYTGRRPPGALPESGDDPARRDSER